MLSSSILMAGTDPGTKDTLTDFPGGTMNWNPRANVGFPGGSDGKASVYNAGDPDSIPGLGISSGEGNGTPLQYYCLEKSHGRRSLVGYSPWGRRELDMTERLYFASVGYRVQGFDP